LALTKVTSDMVSPDPTNASNLSSGDVPLAQLGNAPSTDTTTLEDDIALLGFKVAVAGTMAKYNLVDQTEDAFMDATGIDAGASTGETRNAANYYSGQTPNNATGGTITDVGTDKVHTFLNAGNGSSANDFVVPVGGIASVDFLVIAGGGGGGTGTHGRCGGGGAGGYRASFNSESSGGGGSSETALTMTAATYAVVAGSGGAGIAAGGGTASKGGTGVDSVFSTITSAGGGGGASMSNVNGAAGGSGGGSAVNTDTPGAGTTNQGYAGGLGGSGWNGGGGGGSGQVGQPFAPTVSGAGGYGVSSTITSVSVQRGGGGGGGADAAGQVGAGGAGGGGSGGAGAGNGPDQGTDNTGGGGGGAGQTPGSGRGGHGLVVARYAAQDVGADMVLQSNATTAEATVTKGDIVMTYTNGVGTATLNTDLTAEFSADNGSNWTSTTLVAQGNTGSASPHFIVAAHNVTVGTSGTEMKYRIKTLNQGAAKNTRIQAVSLGWS
jgi:hypothetical protein